MTTTATDFTLQFEECRTIPETNDLYKRLFWDVRADTNTELWMTLSETHRRQMERLSIEVRQNVVDQDDDPNKIRPRTLRNWAASKGIPLSRKGRVPVAIENEYRDEHGLSPLEELVIPEVFPEDPVDEAPAETKELHGPSGKVIASVVRAWANETGVPCGARGRIGPEVIRAYELAHL